MEDVQPAARDFVAPAQRALGRMLSGAMEDAPLIDLGASSLTGIRAGGLPGLAKEQPLGNPIFRTMALEPQLCQKLGSDFVRCGLLFDEPQVSGEPYIDEFGVTWQWDGSEVSPLEHPLEAAEPGDVARHPLPPWRQLVQGGDSEGAIVIADAPCPGVLDLCFRLRGPWRFLEDMVSRPRMTSALLDWSTKAVVQAYDYMLQRLPRQPDVMIYSDDLGFEGSMYFSPADFRAQLLPSLRTVITQLRSLSSAAICFHSCGAIEPILGDIADLGVEIVNLNLSAWGMSATSIRQKLPQSMVLHGTGDLAALGQAITKGDLAVVARLITELAQSAPAIAGPSDSLSSVQEVQNAVRGAAFIRHISGHDFEQLRRIGPVRSIIESALKKTLASRPWPLEAGHI